MTIFDDFNLNKNLEEEDILIYVDEIYNELSPIIDNKIYNIYSKQNTTFSNAIKELFKEQLPNIIRSFFKSEKNINIKYYIIGAISILIKNYINLEKAGCKHTVYICPNCKENGNYINLIQDGIHILKCPECANKNDEVSKKFHTFSKKGYSCPECSRFIPASLANYNKISCPYNDCFFHGEVSGLQIKPCSVIFVDKLTFSNKHNVVGNEISPGRQLDLPFYKDDNSLTKVIANQETENKIKLLIKIINDEIKYIKKYSSATSVQMESMMEAFLNLLEKDVEEMLLYIYGNKKIDSIQSKIFQEYVDIILNKLPLELTRSSGNIEVFKLDDPNLSLFSGLSEFESITDLNGVIKNNTKEHYVGKREFKDYGPCFIGYLLDVYNDSGSLKKQVNYYDFNNIYTNIMPNTKVMVKHFRIESHYQIGSLVYIQNAKKAILARLNKEKK